MNKAVLFLLVLVMLPILVLILPFAVVIVIGPLLVHWRKPKVRINKQMFLRENKAGDTVIFLRDGIDKSRWYAEFLGTPLRLWSDIRYPGDGHDGPGFVFFYLKDPKNGETTAVDFLEEDFTLVDAPAHIVEQYVLERASLRQ